MQMNPTVGTLTGMGNAITELTPCTKARAGKTVVASWQWTKHRESDVTEQTLICQDHRTWHPQQTPGQIRAGQRHAPNFTIITHYCQTWVALTISLA